MTWGRDDRLDVPAVTAAMARGDRQAFDLFYREYFDRIYRYLLVMAGGRRELARDVLQEGMIRAVRYIKPLPDAEALCSWLRRILRSAFIDELRRESWRQALPLDQDPEPAATEPVDPDRHLLEEVHLCLDRLPEQDRLLVEGKYLAGLSYDELATRQGLTVKAVESRLVRARRRLRELVVRRLSHEHE